MRTSSKYSWHSCSRNTHSITITCSSSKSIWNSIVPSFLSCHNRQIISFCKFFTSIAISSFSTTSSSCSPNFYTIISWYRHTPILIWSSIIKCNSCYIYLCTTISTCIAYNKFTFVRICHSLLYICRILEKIIIRFICWHYINYRIKSLHNIYCANHTL